MELSDILTICAIILGPILAVQVERFISRVKDADYRRKLVYKTLMSTRANPLSYEHVRALNSIDVDFYAKKFENTRLKWKEYHDHLEDKSYGVNRLNEWATRKNELLINLLSTMGNDVGHKFDNIDIKRRIYSPAGHQQAEYENMQLRNRLLEILEGKGCLRVHIEQ